MSMLVDKRKIDVVKVFLLYVATVGDVEKTAHAADLDPQTVRDLAASEGWNDKVKRLSLASKSAGLQAGEYERMTNRAMAWVQGHRLRSVIDRVVAKLDEMDDADLVDELTKKDKDGNKTMSARLFSDLAKSIETVNGLCFAALGDTIPERKPATAGGAQDAAALHASLIAALNGPGARGKPSETLLAEAAQAIDTLPNQSGIERKSLPPVPPSENS